jgi:hypothetical protein
MLVLQACAWEWYRPEDQWGGYSDKRIDSDTFLVKFSAPYQTSPDALLVNLLYRCARLTLGYNFEYFIMTQEGVQYDKLPPYSGYHPYTRNDMMTVSPGNSPVLHADRSPTHVGNFAASVVIKLFKDDNNPREPLSINAREVLQFLREHIHEE